MKLNQHDEFMAGIAYKVVVRVRLNEGTYLATDANGDLAAALTVNGKAISFLEIHDRDSQNRIKEVTVTCEYDPLPGAKISSVLIKGVPTPVAGNMPGYSFSLGSSSYGFYNTEPVVWIDKTSNKTLDSSDTFIEGHVYQLCIWLYANREGGFTFKTDEYGKPQVDATINSWAADKVNKAYEQEGREVIEVLYTFPACEASHTCAPQLVQLQKPTCVMPGFKAYYECSCGKCYEDAAAQKEITDLDGYGIIPADGHKEGAWSYNGTHHYKKCTTCKEVIPGTTAAHSGGTATCIEKGKCKVCNYAYLPENEDHIPDTKWTACADLYHAKLCKRCGAHCTPEDHEPGPAATETSPQTCKVCGYIIKPIKNHTHKLSKVEMVPATCLEDGTKEHYACSGCSDRFSDAAGKKKIQEPNALILPALKHDYSDQWDHNDTEHWKVCSRCQEPLAASKAKHDLQNGKCQQCSYTEEVVQTPTTGTEAPDNNQTPTEKPTDGNPDTDKPTDDNQKPTDKPTNDKPDADKESQNSWLIPVVIGVVCFAASIVATVLILKKKKH